MNRGYFVCDSSTRAGLTAATSGVDAYIDRDNKQVGQRIRDPMIIMIRLHYMVCLNDERYDDDHTQHYQD